MSKGKTIAELFTEYTEVFDTLFPNYYWVGGFQLPGVYGWAALEWLMKHGDHEPRLYEEDTLEQLLKQIRQQMKMDNVRGKQ